MATATLTQEQPRSDNALLHASIVIVVGVLATTLAQTHVLARLPLQNLLKNELHVSRAANAAFFFWAGLPWYFKPLAGILTDAFPLLGSRRRSYILIATTLGVLSWIGLYFTPHQYNQLLYVCIVANTFMVVASTVVGGYMVEVAQAASGSGRLTAIRQAVQQACLIINGPSAGYLASIAFGWTALTCGGVLFLLIPATIFFLHEQRKSVDARELLNAAGRQLGKIGSARTMWAAAGLMALFYIAPGLSTAVFYKQQNDLHMTTQGQGLLALIAGLTGVAAAIAYGFACRRIRLRNLLIVCLLAATVTNLGYLFYSSVLAARIVEGVNSFGFSLAELALMDLAIRATPAGSEGLGFSLMMSVRNLALFGTDWLGSFLLEKYHLRFGELVLANSATTLITVPLVLLLPAVLVWRKDEELYEEPAAPRTAIQE
ncbi:MAG: MFS transporter [Caulobacteraceae bacterium]|nr:MFS transporter [Caulobacteraceae bacterium]